MTNSEVYTKVFELCNENKLEEAYNFISDFLKNNKNINKELNDELIYRRALIDFSGLKKFDTQTKEDFEHLISKKNKYYNDSLVLLTLLCDELGETASVIIYGEKALSVTTTLQLDVTFALARAYMSKDSNESKLKALSYNNKCIELIDDDTENACDIYLCRAENYIILNQFEKAFEEIDSTIIQFGHCAKQYFLKARCYFEKYNYDKLDDKSLLQEAEKFAKISIEYEPDNFYYLNLLSIIYIFLEKEDESIKIVEKIYDGEYKHLEIIKRFNKLKKFYKSINYIKNVENYQESWKLMFSLGNIYQETNELELAIKYYNEAYKISKLTSFVSEISKIYADLEKDVENYNFLLENINVQEDGALYFLLANAALKCNKSYEEVLDYYEKSYKAGFLSKLEYYGIYCDYAPVNNKMKKYIKSQYGKRLKENPTWVKQKMAVRLLYGENGFKQNLKKSRRILDSCIEDQNDDSCVFSLLARNYELTNQFKDAFTIYKSAYELVTMEKPFTCDCSYGYYAHALINGIGCEVNEELAKKVILESIDQRKSGQCSHTIYYYTYFALKKEEGFDLEVALEHLKHNYSFYRYEISRIAYLQKVAKLLNIELPLINELIEDGKKQYSKKELEYLNKCQSLEIIKPFWKDI